jgi:hypothetical protein
VVAPNIVATLIMVVMEKEGYCHSQVDGGDTNVFGRIFVLKRMVTVGT